MNAVLLWGQGCIWADSGCTAVLHINEWCTAAECKSAHLLGREPIQGGNLAFYWKQSPVISLRKNQMKVHLHKGTLSYRSSVTFQTSDQLPLSEDAIGITDLDEPGHSLLTHLFQTVFMRYPKKIRLGTFMTVFYQVEWDCRYIFHYVKKYVIVMIIKMKETGISFLKAWSACSRKFALENFCKILYSSIWGQKA